MKILVIGSGGREHALVWKISQSPRVTEILSAPGNAGISALARCVPIEAGQIDDLLDLAQRERVDLTIVGPELPLTLGLVDLFREHGLRVFGATRDAARIESSKAFAKELMKRHHIPTADYGVFEDHASATRYLNEVGAPVVVKADGLAAGKGVIICRTPEEAHRALETIMLQRAFGEAGNRVVIEEFLTGEEASFLAFTDGRTVVPMASAQDHKAVFDADQGPNTGGMGAYSPAPVVTPELHHRIMDEVMVPTIRAMAAEGRPYRGVLYAGMMITDRGPKVLEYNARFGDPETQPVLTRMASDLVPILEACADGTLDGTAIAWKDEASVCVVMASGGYPGGYEQGKIIEGLEEASGLGQVFVFHAGTALREGHVVTAGGRVLGVTALGSGIGEAIHRAYRAVSLINFANVHYRTDIGSKAMQKNGGM